MPIENPGTPSGRDIPQDAEQRPARSGSSGERMRRWARLTGAAVLLVYLASFALPVIDNSEAHFNHMSPAPRGVVLGWHGFLTGWFWPVGWAANPCSGRVWSC